MRFKLLTCEIMFREISLFAAQSPHVIDAVYLPKGLHDTPREMTGVLQAEIDRTDPAQDEAIVLGYGLCSRGTAGVRAREIPLVIPRCHDCITLFLGSRQAYREYFDQHPGTYYFTAGWIERGGATMERMPEEGFGMGQGLQEYVDRYGEDNGRFLWEFENQWQKHYTTAAYITLPGCDSPAVRRSAEEIAARNGWEVVELCGSTRLFEAMCGGEWREADFLIVPPGGEIAQATDEGVLKVAVSGES
jgi:hypothetical protein